MVSDVIGAGIMSNGAYVCRVHSLPFRWVVGAALFLFLKAVCYDNVSSFWGS